MLDQLHFTTKTVASELIKENKIIVAVHKQDTHILQICNIGNVNYHQIEFLFLVIRTHFYSVKEIDIEYVLK